MRARACVRACIGSLSLLIIKANNTLKFLLLINYFKKPIKCTFNKFVNVIKNKVRINAF